MNQRKSETGMKLGFAGFLVSVGVVYGDIGTSPMYVLKSIIAGNGGIASIDQSLILGSLSLIIWTITLLTTVKYVLIAMRADNHGEGGIFALFSLVRHYRKWLIVPAMIGGAALLADGMLTPAVTVTTAVEGLRSIPSFLAILGTDQNKIVLITLIIISSLFMIQRMGTSAIGKAFGPIMMIWFLFLGIFGSAQIFSAPEVLQAFNPLWAIKILFNPDNKAGFMILGSVFLAATGAEALYSDMGHTGKGNIYISWPFVKVCLILNYLGQGAWLINNATSETLAAIPDMNPFFEMLPDNFRIFGVLLGTLAAIIASQALITGSFTLISEAIRLDLMPHMLIIYPSNTKGQLYIPLVKNIMWAACIGLVLFFRSSAHMEAAYGLAITLTMLMTTVLLFYYLWMHEHKLPGAILFLMFFGALETFFFVSSLSKFVHGGYVAVLMGLALLAVMMIWKRGTEIETAQSVYLPIKEYLPMIGQLRNDSGIPTMIENLVYITKARDEDMLDRDVLYSILDKSPKRAKAYWFITIEVTDEPHTREYSVDNFGSDFVFKIRLRLGFRVAQRVNVYLRQIVRELMESGELPDQHRKYSIYNQTAVGPFEFCMIRKTLAPESNITKVDRRVMSMKYAIRHMAGSPFRWYGLESSNMLIEYVPLFIQSVRTSPLQRVPVQHVEEDQ